MKRETNKRLWSILIAIMMVLLTVFGAAAEGTAAADEAAAKYEAFQKDMMEKLGQFTYKDETTLEIDAGDVEGFSKEVVTAIATKMRATLEINYTVEGEQKHLTLYSRDALLLKELDGSLNFVSAVAQMQENSYARDQKIQQQIMDGETPQLPADGTIDPKIPRFMQSSISNKTGEYTVLGNAEAIREGKLSPNDLSLVRLWVDDNGEIWTLDHRRLAAYKMAGLEEIPFRWATEVELSTEYWKMDTKDNGESMVVRMKREGVQDPVVYRDGTITGLWNDELVEKYESSIFRNEEINKLVDENYKEVQEKGYAELRIPRELHNIQETVMTPNSMDAAHKLLEAGYSVYVIGGCVRDFIMGTDSNDIDLVTNATLEQQQAIFGEALHTHDARGRTFGVVYYPDEKVDLCEMQNIPAEYKDIEGLPEFDPEKLTSDSVLFDSFQRDLTINAIYYDVSNGDLVDFHGGIHDIREKVLETMVRADVELEANPSVALRALRFAARYGFSFSDKLDRSLRENGKSYLAKIDDHEVYGNVSKMLIAGYATEAYALLKQYDLVGAIYPSVAELAGTEEYEAYVEKALATLDKQYETTGKDASRMLANWTIMMPAVFRLTGVLSTKEAVTKVLNDQITRFEMNKDLEKFSDTLEMAFFMNTVASRFQKSAIERSPYYVDALTLFGMMDLITETNEGQKTFWANVALEEPDIAEVLTEEEKIPTAEEEAQMEEEKLQEDLADAA